MIPFQKKLGPFLWENEWALALFLEVRKIASDYVSHQLATMLHGIPCG